MMKRVFIGVLALSLVFTVGFVTESSDNYFEISKNLDIFGKLYREINSYYVDDPDPNELMRTGIDAMLGTLDPYTNYISEEEVSDYQFLTTGTYAGIGALIGKRGDRLMVMEPYEKYPAEVAGLRAGDILLNVEGTPIDGKNMNVSDVRDLLRGEQGSEAKMTVKRGEEILDFVVKRGSIRINNVPYFGMATENIGYISLTGFTQDAGKEVAEALAELSKNKNLSGVILDLRGNPGGRLDEAVNVSNVFIEKDQLIVETRGRIPSSKRQHFARKSPVDTDISLVVLVNGKSASASEIVAGAIQDTDRGMIVGRRSFGKGLVQNIRPLSYNTQIKVTIAKYYTPSGRCIQAINYAEKNPDGSVARIPDSLKNSFTTANGRVVYDGGGIGPDVTVEDQASLTLIAELDKQGLIFDFVTDFVRKTPEIGAPRAFRVTDELYNEFTAYVESQDFSYTTEAEKKLAEFEKMVESEAYASELQGKISLLEAQMEKQKDMDLNLHKDEILPLIHEEILKRYYHERGALEGALDTDPDVLEAVRLLSNNTEYQGFLRP